MGFRSPDLDPAYQAIRQSIGEISSSRNDGFTSSRCKQELYQLKCWLEDAYIELPTFVGEEQWEQERVVKILKR
jgi:hypothetical protein